MNRLSPALARADNSRVHPEPFNPNSRLRASDNDREQAAAVINSALADGRLTVPEHSDRLDKIYQAKTQAEIVPLIDDLPVNATTPAPVRRGDLAPATGRRQVIIAIFGGASRKGQWHVEPNMTAVTIFGGASLDFRDVELPAQEIRLHASCVFGGIDITVPPEMRVVDSGFALFGGRDVGSGSAESTNPNSPVLRLSGITLFGGLGAKHKQRKARQDKGNRY
jgi:Domain of unknown function (DUF1707)/Cell wall-active antibiotics response 4TMS YvqF